MRSLLEFENGQSNIVSQDSSPLLQTQQVRVLPEFRQHGPNVSVPGQLQLVYDCEQYASVRVVFGQDSDQTAHTGDACGLRVHHDRAREDGVLDKAQRHKTRNDRAADRRRVIVFGEHLPKRQVLQAHSCRLVFAQ